MPLILNPKLKSPYILTAMIQKKMGIIGKDSTITLERRTQEYYLKEVVRVICNNKSEKGSTRPQVMQHPLLPRISEHGYLGDSMIVNILVDKFCHHLPEYRQAKIFREHGLDIPTSTINRAVHQAIDKLYPIYYAQMKVVLRSPYVYMEETQKEREEKSVPILNKIEQWLKQKSLETTSKSALGEAISYTLKRWDKLCAYVTNGMYHIDNNPVERSIRPIALGRKN